VKVRTVEHLELEELFYDFGKRTVRLGFCILSRNAFADSCEQSKGNVASVLN
jgi:hypothetical protein